MSLRDRLTRLEAQTKNQDEPLTESDRQQAERWPEIMLARYCEDRLDALAARPDMPVIGQLLRNLAVAGYAVEVGGHWHPLFAGNDTEINEQVFTRLDAVDPERINQALALREAATNS